MIEMIIIGITSVFFYENADYFSVAKKQYKEGYSLEYVGVKETDDKAVSIPIKVLDNKEYIMFKLKR